VSSRLYARNDPHGAFRATRGIFHSVMLAATRARRNRSSSGRRFACKHQAQRPVAIRGVRDEGGAMKRIERRQTSPTPLPQEAAMEKIGTEGLLPETPVDSKDEGQNDPETESSKQSKDKAEESVVEETPEKEAKKAGEHKAKKTGEEKVKKTSE